MYLFRALSVDRIIQVPKTDIPKEIMANPVGSAVKEAGGAVMATVVAEITAKCEEYRVGSSLVIPQRANLLCAYAI